MADVWADTNLYWGLALVPISWIVIYVLFDKYQDVYRYSRLSTLSRTLIITFMGCLLLFFTIMTDDTVLRYTTYFNNFFKYFFLHSFCTALFRLSFLTYAKSQVRARKVTFPTLIIGGDTNALELYQEIIAKPHVHGHVEDIPQIVEDHELSDVIVAVETTEHNKVKDIFDVLFDVADDLELHVIPDMYDIMLGNVKMSHIYGAVLISVQQDLMPKWHRKRSEAI